METHFVPVWKPLALRGLAGVLFGAVALLWPSLTFAALVLLFGAYALLDGLLAIAAAARQRAPEHAWKLVLEGLVGVGFGLAAFLWTGMTALVLVKLIALWAIVTGILEIALAARLRGIHASEFLLGLAGTVSLVLGALMFLWPAASAFVMVVLLGSYALLFGTTMLVFALRLRRVGVRLETVQHELRSPRDAA